MEGSDEGMESDKHWGKCLYQFDEQYAAGIAIQNKQWLKEEIICRAAPLLDRLQCYKILAVGSGTGTADKVLLELISEHLKSLSIKGPKIVYTVVEPDSEAVELCKKNLGSVSGIDISFNWEVMKMEDYFKKNQGHFEMVHFIHSLCNVTRCATVIPEVLRKNYVRSDGVLFTVLGDFETNFFLKLYFANEDKLTHSSSRHCHHGEGETVHQKEYKTASHVHSGHTHSHQLEHGIVGVADVQNLEKAIKECNWKCKIFSREVKEDVTEILLHSTQGLRRLSYLLHTKDIQKVLSKDDLNNIVDQVSSAAVTEISDGKEKKCVKAINRVVIVFHD